MSMTKAFHIAAAAFLITAVAIKAAPALAEPAQTTVNVSHVRTADLDLSSPSGQRVLDIRLAHAARDVCGAAPDIDLVGQNDIRKCRVEVLAKASAQRERLLASAGRGRAITVADAR